MRLNKEERLWIDQIKLKIKQPKDSTAFKQLAKIGAYVLQQPQTEYIINELFENVRRNKRVNEVEYT